MLGKQRVVTQHQHFRATRRQACGTCRRNQCLSSARRALNSNAWYRVESIDDVELLLEEADQHGFVVVDLRAEQRHEPEIRRDRVHDGLRIERPDPSAECVRERAFKRFGGIAKIVLADQQLARKVGAQAAVDDHVGQGDGPGEGRAAAGEVAIRHTAQEVGKAVTRSKGLLAGILDHVAFTRSPVGRVPFAGLARDFATFDLDAQHAATWIEHDDVEFHLAKAFRLAPAGGDTLPMQDDPLRRQIAFERVQDLPFGAWRRVVDGHWNEAGHPGSVFDL